MQDGVVLLHGIFLTKRSMHSIEKFLQKNGFKTLNVGYRSTRIPLENIVGEIHPQIQKFSEMIDGKVHFIGFSMGGLVVRAYLNRFRPKNLGRVVMLGTPNKGSPVADLLKNIFFYKKLYGPAGQQLITNQESISHLFGIVDYELGIIAGNKTIDPISSYIIGGVNDGKVSVESTKLDGMKDHIVIPAMHTFFPSYKAAQMQTLEFLKNGEFRHN